MIKADSLSRFKGGWFIGNFEPSLFKTDDFEIAVKTHPAFEEWPEHYHAVATEYNVVVEGHVIINDYDHYWDGDIFIVEPGDTIKPYFKTDCTIVTVKVPCVLGDKYVVHKSQGEHGGEESGSGE